MNTAQSTVQSTPVPKGYRYHWYSALESIDIAMADARNPSLMLRFCEGGDARENLEWLFHELELLFRRHPDPEARNRWLDAIAELHRTTMLRLPSFRVMTQ